jgi:hypothetical protein
VRRTYRHEVVLLRTGPGLRQPTDRPLLLAALCYLTLYAFELMANATNEQRIGIPNQGTLMFLPRRSVKQRQFCRVSYEQKWGRKKWTDVIRNS